MEEGIRLISDHKTGNIYIEWDPEDPKWKMLNTLSEQEINLLITKLIENGQTVEGN